MPDHEFDKTIGEKAGLLLLEPSPEVWEAVAARLKEKKRRRALIWWFSGVSLLLISLGAAWQLQYRDGYEQSPNQLNIPVARTVPPTSEQPKKAPLL
ncbi:MAG: hypothetical protein QM664_05750 [Flavihumibacter sp.]